MIAALATFLAERSLRERGLLLALLLLVLPITLGALVALPLIAARTAARTDLVAAEARRDWYVALQAEIAALPAQGEGNSMATVGLGQIEATLIAVGLRDGLERLAPTPTGGIEVVLADVAFDQVMPWIEDIGANLGLRVATLSLIRSAPGRVDVRLDLMR